MRAARGLFGLLSAVAAAASAFSTLRAARGDGDKLALVNAAGSILVAVTGAAMAVRAYRKDGLA
ncbi:MULTISPECIES: hypothetical protein [Actinosynnema]|uniref:hypothetical protein n=1 Tax=Actinosynnema TaxID=40566 RepID=UPI0020A39888|nr:hypothetical protein [Actinosynnema pretiosum]MCP2093854.1 hypothetical protein [Actinosynnema pretiosum]